MKVEVIHVGVVGSFQPINVAVKDCVVAGITLENALIERVNSVKPDKGVNVRIRADFWPSKDFLKEFVRKENSVVYAEFEGETVLMAWHGTTKKPPKNARALEVDEKSRILKYPWDLLFVNEEIIGQLKDSKIDGLVRDGVNIDGNVVLGKGSVLLPGVYIEGNVIIGRGCKLGPNCYIRGNTYIGDNCHVGQAVEVKNSILMNNVSVGHLSYVGDSIIGEKTNFGAGTTIANLRHDGKNHFSRVEGDLVDTGRRKLGVIVGDNVHTGINTTIYPGRKIWPRKSTLPGEIVKRDIVGC